MIQTSTPATTTEYYNPVHRIKSLINNLDAELLELCSQCPSPTKAKPEIFSTKVVPACILGKSVMSDSQKSLNERSKSSNKMLGNQSSVQHRTMSSIYRARVIDAYRHRRIFQVYGNYHTLRRALLRRGWLEKLTPSRYPKLQGLSEDVLLHHAKKGNDYEAVVISKIINHFPAFFIWQGKGMKDMNPDVLPHRNRVRRARTLDFSTKVGLIGCAENEQWFRQPGVCGMSNPRFYRLGGSFEERLAFIEDFRCTQCRSLLLFVVENMDNPNELYDAEDGIVSTNVISYALSRVNRMINDWENTGLDDSKQAGTTADNESAEWKDFFNNSNIILSKKGIFKSDAREMLEYARMAKNFLHKIEETRPDYRWDGFRNLWILKPGYSCRGLGIIIRSDLDDILAWSTNNTGRRYIVQKYIERPLLIYKTKFDIRQYMLLNIGFQTVSIWLYRDCYLRFSSQEFSISDLRESIHLTNNSVQKKYKNNTNRDARLPRNNMWSLEQFKLFLKYNNSPEDTWEKKIYAGFRENLVAVVLASMDETDFVENAFEMYGCDFMLDEKYNPILIEINSTPDLSPSTDVTSKICPNALKDLVKVIVDLPRNSKSSTGLFEKVFEVNYKTKREVDPQGGLNISGTHMALHKPQTSLKGNKTNFKFKMFRRPTKKSEISKTNITQKKKKINSLTNDEPIDNITGIQIVPTKPLKPFAKEALALKYTKPK